jgi:predicted nucleic acid-binding protein
MSCVLDASIALSWCFQDETSPQTDEFAADVAETGAIVPALWHLELINTIILGERRGRITLAETTERLNFLASLPIITEPETINRAWSEILLLARAHQLTSYDATYLELAIRKNLPLATLDKKLISAAKVAGVSLLP